MTTAPAPASDRWRRLVRRAALEPTSLEVCDLCAEPIPDRHRHLLDLREDEVLCACQACSLLFDRGAAGEGHYRRIPDRRIRLEGLDVDDATWQDLGVPVGLAYFVPEGASGEIVAWYPSPAGPTDGTVDAEAWSRLVVRAPELGDIEDDVEALLVNRLRGFREHWLLPIEDCYRLVGLFRSHWSGFGGGDDLWRELGAYFDDLKATARR